ncbi:ABC transporter substrate-binding protein [Nocardioides pocheonensis]|uniref:ABC transporter substrate-binding protein n=1 Tax=Nocardioides pocheonensis TaxID=661485 RepID=A0A3N0GJH9_9ACTN|nr:ABC transporter substrate-binding protein [Nocardioides pocheonensis]RNM12634.1 ABC transporter substrate-binding protein [Nocardioides pocheonensis]
MLTSSTFRRPLRNLVAIATALLLALAATACGGNDTTSKSESGELKVGWLPFAGLGGWQLALDKGYFEDSGLKVKKVELRTPADVVPNLLNGTIDFSALNPGNLAQALAQGLKLKIIGTTYMVNNDMSILSMKDSGITKPKDLEGKKVGLIQLQNNNHAALLKTLENDGVDVNSIKFVLIPATEMPAALRSGQIDAGHVLYPLAATMAGETNTVIENMTEPYGEQPVQAYNIVSAKFAAENPQLVDKLRSVLARGNQLASSDKEALITAIAEITGAPEGLIRTSKLPAFGTDLKIESSQHELELMTKYGFLKDPVKLADYVDES